MGRRDDWWPGDPRVPWIRGELHPMEKQNLITETLLRHRATIRKVYISFCIRGETDPQKAFTCRR